MPSDSKRIIADVSVLYELSLSIGQSLDLEQNCQRFLKALMSRKNLGFAAVWLRAGQLWNSTRVSGDGYHVVYATPRFRVRETELPVDHPVIARLQGRDAYSLSASQPGFAEIVTEKDVDGGAFAVFALGSIGFLKLYSLARNSALTDEEMNQLTNVVSKFTVSLEGCIAHHNVLREDAERRQAQEALLQSEEKYRNVVERASDGILIIQDDKVIYVNGRLAKMAGTSVEELLGAPFTRFIHPADAQKVQDLYQRRVSGEAVPPVYEATLVDRSNRPILVEINAGLTTFAGRPADLVFIRDISERTKFEAERLRLAMAVEQTADAVVITDTRGIIMYVNPAFERITGYLRGEVSGQNPRILKSGKQSASVYQSMWESLSQGEVWRGRFQNRRKDGSLFTCDTIITPIRDEKGGIINYVSVQRDVTRELQMEEQYLQAQKMESIGRLAGGIAHDFNNIMTAILGFGSMILDQLGDNHPLRHAMEQIVSAGERATNLTRQLLTFSRKQMVEVRILDVNAVIVEMNQLLRRALGEDIELVSLLDDDSSTIKADAGLLQQVIMNLAINARDAMPRGGQLVIHTGRAQLDEKFCRSRVNVKPGDYVLLALRDSGTGMPKDVLDHLFEPFFTTKPKGKGTGLGLATVYGIVKQCNGHIEVESEPGVGTEVKIWFPRVETPSDGVPVEIEEKIQSGTETILVVEDEEIVRDLTTRILKSLGYNVLQACHGKEALSLLDQYKDPIHLVLTDVVMPHMGGPEMVERLLQIRPDVKVLYTSGFTESTVVERGVAVGNLRLIQKPYTREILAQKVRQALDER